MFEFEVIEEIKPNTEILEIMKQCTFSILLRKRMKE